MVYLWGRNAAVIIGIKGQQGRKIRFLRMVFEIEKTRTASANTGKLTIFNLSPDTAALLEHEPEADVQIILEVGYGDNLDMLFIGDLTNSSTSPQGADWITDIECSSGMSATKSARIDKSYAANTPYKTIAADIVKSLQNAGQVVAGSMADLKNQIAQNGFSAAGMSHEILERVMRAMGGEFSIQDNEIQIIEKDGHTPDEAVLLTPRTGLIGSPIKKNKGIEFKALIQEKIRPGRRIKIESKGVNGIYTVRVCRFSGDTHGQHWYVMGAAK